MNDPFGHLVAGSNPTVVIVTTGQSTERSGCLVGFHAQCAIEPPRYAVWLSKANRTYRVALASQTFAVHWIPADRHDLAELFGHETGDRIDKFTRCHWQEGPDGVPLLDGCPDRFVARRVGWIDLDIDHCCLVLAPIDVTARTAGGHDSPLLPDGSSVLRLSDVAGIEAGHSP